MVPLSLNITISNRIDLSATVVRGIWFKQDILSDFCPTFNPLHEMQFETLDETLIKEWNVRKSMTDKHLEEMKKKREAYEEKMEQARKDEEENKKKKTSKAAKGSKAAEGSKAAKDSKVAKNVKASKGSKALKTAKKSEVEIEPPIVDESTYVDVADEYEAFEDSQTSEELKRLSPEMFGMSEHDVRLEMIRFAFNSRI